MTITIGLWIVPAGFTAFHFVWVLAGKPSGMTDPNWAALGSIRLAAAAASWITWGASWLF